ncbi:glycoside hydrolase family 88 protein [Paenibacillus sp. NPDC058071]|uniref:glycoside hydrolase family 88 protein n=1 Tax=Paenibacillus sp. NPDC058071 TaxID=3346326 RepID=UPI0036D79555
MNATVERVKRAMLGMQRQSWEQGVAAQAFIESGYVEDAVLLAHDSVVRQDETGRLGVINNERAVTDAAANGEPVLFAYKQTGDVKYKEAAEQMANYLLNVAPRTENGALSHVNHQSQVWVDSFYMAPPFLASAGHFEEAVAQVERFRELMLITEKGMHAHIWDDGEKKFHRADCWGVGNGWAAAGMARVIRTLPESMNADKERIIGYVRDLLEVCMRYQREDGLFHDVLDNPETFVETNAAQMFAYTIYTGVKEGWLDERYLANANRMRSAANAKVDEQGFVTGVCGSPMFDRSGTATEGQAFFILMEAVAF